MEGGNKGKGGKTVASLRTVPTRMVGDSALSARGSIKR